MRDAAAKPTVTFVCEGLVTSVGGAEKVLCDVASHLAMAGFDVDVVTHEKTPGAPFFALSPKVRYLPLRPTPDTYGPLRRYLAEPLRDVSRDLFHALRLHRVPGLAWLAWFDRQGMFRRRLETYLAQNPRDVAIAFMPHAIAALGLARSPHPLARIASTHTTPARDFDEQTDAKANVSQRALTLKSLQDFDRITVLLPEFQAWYPADLRDRTVVIPNAVSPAAQSPKREKLLLAVGRHIGVKGHDLLINAWVRIAPDFPEWQVEIYGQGPDRQALSNRITALKLDRLRLMGTTKDVASLYSRASLLAHPSRVEGFSLVVAEALAAGVPAVGFADCAGVNSLIQDGINGILAPGSNNRDACVAALAAALAAMLSNADKRKRMGQSGPTSVARFAPEKIMQIWEQLVLETAQAKSDR